MNGKAMTRRDFLKGAAAVAGTAVLSTSQKETLWKTFTGAKPSGGWRVTGPAVPGLESFDQTMQTYMQARNVPGGQLAVVRNGKLVYARGFSWQHPETPAVEPTSLFRIASVSKPFTATAIMRLVQEQKLRLEDRMMDILELKPYRGGTVDPRLGQVTVLNLLQHQGGWDRGLVPDPMFLDAEIAKTLKASLPISQADIISYVTGQPIQHDPGTVYAYSNYGYLLLGRIIEKVSGTSYADHIQSRVLKPLGITRMRQGRSLPEFRDPTEVPYYSVYTGASVFSDKRQMVPYPDGAFNLENMDSHGAWLASAVDLVRYGTTFDTPGGCPILGEPMIETMFARPATGFPPDNAWFYACGWLVRPKPVNRNTWHDGSLPGTIALLVRRWDGLDWAVLFNQRDDQSDRAGATYWDIDGALHRAADAVKTWPNGDQFGMYF